MIESATFEVADMTVQLVGKTVLLWTGFADHPPDIQMPSDDFLTIASYIIDNALPAPANR